MHESCCWHNFYLHVLTASTMAPALFFQERIARPLQSRADCIDREWRKDDPGSPTCLRRVAHPDDRAGPDPWYSRHDLIMRKSLADGTVTFYRTDHQRYPGEPAQTRVYRAASTVVSAFVPLFALSMTRMFPCFLTDMCPATPGKVDRAARDCAEHHRGSYL